MRYHGLQLDKFMKIYTKKGDSGETGLLGGTRVSKDHARIEAYGTVDELNSHIGLLGTFEASQPHLSHLRAIQDAIFTLGSHLANDPETSSFKLPPFEVQHITSLESYIDAMEAELPELKNFVLPGGHPVNAHTHIARCVCRRAERRVVALSSHAAVEPAIIQYLNRLSDWLFVLARKITAETGSEEVAWKPGT